MKFDVIVAGAGFGGMYALHKLRGLGFSVRVLEAGGGVGGTWYWNRYPGARCDVQSMDYGFSFDEELQQEWNWTEKYAPQPEILRYANHVAERFDLLRDIQFNTRIRSARYNEATESWAIETDTDETFEAQHYVMATGCLSMPKEVDVPGKANFEGPTYHTAAWPHEGVDFTGKRVAVIGTGSSAIQSIPIIASQAKSLTVYQRTAAYSLPAFNRELSDEERDNWKAKYTEHRELSRRSMFGVPDTPVVDKAFDVDDEERERRYEVAWKRGELVALMQQFNDLLVDQAANDTVSEFVRNKIRSIVNDPETAEALCPKTFPLGTKRACLDTNYYATFNEPHVELVNLREHPIETVTATGIKSADAEREFDAVVFATGFDAMTGAIVNVDVRGVGGIELKDKWSDGTHTYLGVASAGFPNFFMITGPGSPSVMSNMIISIEQHVEWVADCLCFLRDKGYRSIEASEEAEREWGQHVNDVANSTLFPKANSWYMGANVEGKHRQFMPYIGGVGPYREKCDEVAAEGYSGFVLGGAEARRATG